MKNPTFVPLPQPSPQYFTMTFSPPGATQATNATSPWQSHRQPEWAQMMRISSTWATWALPCPWHASTSSAHLREDNHPGRCEQHVQQTGWLKPRHHSCSFNKTCAVITQNSPWRYSAETGECTETFYSGGAALEQPEVVFADKTSPSEEAEKEAEVACEVQQRIISHQINSKLRCIFRAVTMTFCFPVLFVV